MTQELTTTQGQALSLVDIRLDPVSYPHFKRIDAYKQVHGLQAILLSCYKAKHLNDLSCLPTDAQLLAQKIMGHPQYRELTEKEIGAALINLATGSYGGTHSFTVEDCLKALRGYIDEHEAEYLEAQRKARDKANKAEIARQIEDIKRRYAYMKAEAIQKEKEREQAEAEVRKQLAQTLKTDKNG